MVVSIVGCTIAILSIWNTWANRSIAVTFDDKSTPISTIPFPAITICTTQKIAENVAQVGENDGFEQIFPGE